MFPVSATEKIYVHIGMDNLAVRSIYCLLTLSGTHYFRYLKERGGVGFHPLDFPDTGFGFCFTVGSGSVFSSLIRIEIRSDPDCFS